MMSTTGRVTVFWKDAGHKNIHSNKVSIEQVIRKVLLWPIGIVEFGQTSHVCRNGECNHLPGTGNVKNVIWLLTY